MSNSCNVLAEFISKIEPNELNEVSDISKKFNDFLAKVFGNDFVGGLVKSLDWLNFSDNKKDLIMAISKIDPNYDFKTLQVLDEEHFIYEYLRDSGIQLQNLDKRLFQCLSDNVKDLIMTILKVNPNHNFSKLRALDEMHLLEEYMRLEYIVFKLNDDGSIPKLKIKSMYSLNHLHIPIIFFEKGLEKLIIDGCSNLESLGGLPESLNELNIEGCSNLASLEFLPEGLEKLEICNCNNLKSLEGLPDGLEQLTIHNCVKLESLEGLPAGLKQLTLNGCSNIKSVGVLPEGLENLTIRSCSNLGSLEDLPNNLRSLVLQRCHALRSLGDFPQGLERLLIEECMKYSRLSSLGNLPKGLLEYTISPGDNLESIVDLPQSITRLFICKWTFDGLNDVLKARLQKIKNLIKL